MAGRVTTIEEVGNDDSCKYMTGRLTCTVSRKGIGIGIG